MPQASPELQGKFPGMDTEAWAVLEVHYSEFRFMIYPNEIGYAGTERECDAIDYLIQEWDWDYDPNYANSDEVKNEHKRKMKIVHAVWLIARLHNDGETDKIIGDVAKLMGLEPHLLFVGFDKDYLDRAWCSRPADWKPQDSLA